MQFFDLRRRVSCYFYLIIKTFLRALHYNVIMHKQKGIIDKFKRCYIIRKSIIDKSKRCHIIRKSITDKRNTIQEKNK